jgi:hypothetical protein
VIIPTTGDRAKNMHYALKNAGMFCMLYSFVKYMCLLLPIAITAAIANLCRPLPSARAARLVQAPAEEQGPLCCIFPQRPNPIHRT